MKKRIVIESFALFFTFFTVAYLMGAFYSTTLNIAAWSETTRGVCVGVGSFVGLIAVVINIDR